MSWPKEHRRGRIGEAVAHWVYDTAGKRTDPEFELVDIKDFNLPLLDAPKSPTLSFTGNGTTKWRGL